jgi:hypothetical protein
MGPGGEVDGRLDAVAVEISIGRVPPVQPGDSTSKGGLELPQGSGHVPWHDAVDAADPDAHPLEAGLAAELANQRGDAIGVEARHRRRVPLFGQLDAGRDVACGLLDQARQHPAEIFPQLGTVVVPVRGRHGLFAA